MKCFFAAVLWVAFFAQTLVLSATSPVVRVTIEPETVAVGEPLSLTITVLVPTWFPSPSVYPSFEVAGAVTRLPPDSSYPGRGEVDGESWSGIVRQYRIYPLVGATYRLSGLTMQVTYADPDSLKPVTVEIAVPQIEFRGEVPPGAAGLDPYLAGRKLTLIREIEGVFDGLEVGDAIVLRTVAELDGLPSIFLPPLIAPHELDGVSIYADEPVFEDDDLARRMERQTLVFDAGGEFIVPGATFEWWNTETEAIERATIEPLSFTVTGAGVEAGSETELASERPNRRALWTVLVGVGAVIFIMWRLQPARRINTILERWKEKRRQSETYAFGRLRQALRSKDSREVYRALLHWRERFELGIDFAPGSDLHGQIEVLGRALYSEKAPAVDLVRLERLLVVGRQVALRRSADGYRSALPPLN